MASAAPTKQRHGMAVVVCVHHKFALPLPLCYDAEDNDDDALEPCVKSEQSQSGWHDNNLWPPIQFDSA